MPTQVLTDADITVFRSLLIPDELIERANIRRVTAAEAELDFGIKTSGGDGLVFPYFNPSNGSERRRLSARLRCDNPPRDSNGKADRKYISPLGDNRHLYFAPVDPGWLENPDTPVVFIEAEKSALAILAWCERHDRRLIPVALGGCWGWRGRIGKAVTANGVRVDEKGPLPDLEIARGRKAYVIYDANCLRNQSVYAARERLCNELAKMAPSIRTIDLPDLPGVNGPDDFIGQQGDTAFFDLFETATQRGSASGAKLVVHELNSYLKMKFPPREPLAVIDEFETPVLTKRSINQIFAWRGTGKSMIALALAGSFAKATPFLNWKFPRPAKVLYIDGELPDAQLQERAAELVGQTENLRLVSLDSQPNGMPSLLSEEGQAAIEAVLDDTEVVIFDSISTLFQFTTNDEEKWIPLIAWFQKLRSRGLCTIFLHHAGKGGMQRGHSKSEDPLDVSIKLAADENEDRDYLKCELRYEKFRARRPGVRSLTIECREAVWSWSLLETDKIKMLEEYLCQHPGASTRAIERDCPDLGSHNTISKLLKKLKSEARDEW